MVSKISLPNLKIVGLMTKHSIVEKHLGAFKKLIKFLKKQKKQILVDPHIAAFIKNESVASHEELMKRCDLVVVLGGDGTLLRAAAQTAPKPTLVLGVNFGNLGFLTVSKPSELEKDLGQIFRKKYTVERRSLLEVFLIREGRRSQTWRALNDAVINQVFSSKLTEIKIHLDGQDFVNFRGDGLIISTATGSSAHALSAGGPLLEPSVPALVLTPICPINFNFRPIVIPERSQITLTLLPHQKENKNIGLTLDGQEIIPLHHSDIIEIRTSKRQFHLIRPLLLERLESRSENNSEQLNYYRLIKEKLHWGKSATL